MATIEFVKKMFGKKKSLQDISLDDLRRERIRLEQEERKYIRRIEEIEDEKKALFMQGKDDASRRKQEILARKILEKDAEAKNVDKNLKMFSYQLRIINGFVQLKENQRILQESGVSTIISRVDLSELQKYVDEASIDGEFHMDKFSDIIGTLEEPGKMAGPVKQDREIAAIVEAMQGAHEAEEQDPEAVEKTYQEVNKLLAKEKPEEES